MLHQLLKESFQFDESPPTIPKRYLENLLLNICVGTNSDVVSHEFNATLV